MPCTAENRWTPDMDAALSSFWGSMTCKEISFAMSTSFERRITRNSIVSRAHRLHLPTLPNPAKIRRKKQTKPKERWVGGLDEHHRPMNEPGWVRVTAAQREMFLNPHYKDPRCFCGKFALPGKSHCYGDMHGEFHG